MSSHRLALLQMDTPEGDPETCRAEVRSAAKRARMAGADILVLPELWSSGYDLRRSTAAGDWSRDFVALAEISREQQILLLGGSILDGAVARQYRNAAVAFEQGQEINRYHKAHLFGPLGEDQYLRPGDEPPRTFRSERGLCVAQTLCYDLRFPEIYRPLALAGAELIVVSAQWPVTRISHWIALLCARAIESQCYVVGVNRKGCYGSTEFGGRSQLVDPMGQVLADAGDQHGLFYGTIDVEEVESFRRQFPYLEDRRKWATES